MIVTSGGGGSTYWFDCSQPPTRITMAGRVRIQIVRERREKVRSAVTQPPQKKLVAKTTNHSSRNNENTRA